MFVVPASVAVFVDVLEFVGFCAETEAFPTDVADVEDAFVEMVCVDEAEVVAGFGETFDTATGVDAGFSGQSPLGFPAMEESEVALPGDTF